MIQSKKVQQGFTLIELMIVVAIIGMGSTPILRTLQRSPIMGKRSVYVEEKKVQPGVQTRCG